MESSGRNSSRLGRRSEVGLRSTSSASNHHPTSSTPRRQTMTSPSHPSPPSQLGVAAKSRRSEAHAQEMDQLRAQSRAGFSSRAGHDEDSDDDYDDRGEGSSARPASRRHTTTYRNGPRVTSPLSRATELSSSGGHDTAETERTHRPVGSRRATASMSPQSQTLPYLPSSGSRHQPIPDEFFPSDRRTRQGSEETVLNRPSDIAADTPGPRSASRSRNRRRHASDAQADDIPSFDYEGRAGLGLAKLSVDASSAKRHLAAATRARTTSGPHASAAVAATTMGLSPRLGMQDLLEMSPHEAGLRARGMSVASPASGARPSSRLSSGGGGNDPFDDNSMRSPTLRARPDLPPEALERVRALRLRQEALHAVPLSSRTNKEGGSGAAHSSTVGSAIDDVRARIEDIDIRGSAISTASRSSSVISSAPRPRAHTAQVDRQRLLAEQQRANAPSSEPRHRVEDSAQLRPNGLSHEPLRRYASQAAFPSTPDVAAHSTSHRPASRFSTFSRGVTPGPVLTSTSSATKRGAGATTAHERNLLVAFDLFERNFGGTDVSVHTSPTAARLFGPESGDLVEKARGFLDTVTTLNAGLRDVAQFVIQREIDAEVDASLDVPVGGGASSASGPASSTLSILKDLDSAVGSLVKYSDNQVRNLGELLHSFTRADRERTRAMRVAAGAGEYDRPESRMSARTGTPTTVNNWSPTRRGGSLRRGATLGSAGAITMDGSSISGSRRAGSVAGSVSQAPTSGLRRETRDIRQATASSVAGSDYGSVDRRSSIYRSGDRGNASSSVAGSSVANGIAPDDPRTSPTMNISSHQSQHRPRNSAVAGGNQGQQHGRSYSELSPGPLSTADERFPSTRQRLDFLKQRREREREQREQERNSPATIGRAGTLPLRRPKLSDPSVATAIAASSNMHAMSDGPVAYSRNHLEDGDSDYNNALSGDSAVDSARGGETPRLGMNMKTSRDEMPPPPPAFRHLQRATSRVGLGMDSPVAAKQEDGWYYSQPRNHERRASSGTTATPGFSPGLPSPQRPSRNPRRSMILTRSDSARTTGDESEEGGAGRGMGSGTFDGLLDGYENSEEGGQSSHHRAQSVAGYSPPKGRIVDLHQQQHLKGPSAWRPPTAKGDFVGGSGSNNSGSPSSATMGHTISARTSLRQSLAAATAGAGEEGRGMRESGR